ncbi:hypothetical protein GA0115250_11229, partial [Streptomyces sp. BvitLS-983]
MVGGQVDGDRAVPSGAEDRSDAPGRALRRIGLVGGGRPAGQQGGRGGAGQAQFVQEAGGAGERGGDPGVRLGRGGV